MTDMLGLLVLAFVLGMRHATDVDHLAAVTTIVSQRRSAWSAALVGALWGLGHTTSLVAAAIAVIALHTQIPPRVEHGLEMGVAIMLIGLGINLLRTLGRGGALHLHPHRHGGGRDHVHPHRHAPGERTAPHHHEPAIGRRPFWVGLVHGLAGSAALMLTVAATIPSARLAFGYVLVFGFGSVGGMMVMSVLLGGPMAWVVHRFAHAEWALSGLAALGSVTVGVAMVLGG